MNFVMNRRTAIAGVLASVAASSMMMNKAFAQEAKVHSTTSTRACS